MNPKTIKTLLAAAILLASSPMAMAYYNFGCYAKSDPGTVYNQNWEYESGYYLTSGATFWAGDTRPFCTDAEGSARHASAAYMCDTVGSWAWY